MRRRRLAGVGALVLVLAALFGASVAAADPDDAGAPDASSTTTTTLPSTTTSTTSTTVAPIAVEPARPAPTTSTPAPPSTPTTALAPSVRAEHHGDGDECHDGEYGDLPTVTDLDGPGRVLLGRIVQFEV